MELLYININRFHPLFVHLPIGILLFAFLLELLKRWKKRTDLDTSIQLALLIGSGAAIASVFTGLLLANEGGYEEEMLVKHKWLGIVMTVFSVLLYLSKSSQKPILSKLYFPLFILVISLLTTTGHYGGNITHGSDYLFSKPVDNSIVIADIDQANVYEAIIVPILKNKCNSCHNPSKTKGDLIMTTKEGLITGGKTGEIFDFKAPAKSAFLTRIHLPESEKKHMPPKGKKQLNEDEIKLLEWWIENKACFDCMVKNTTNRETVQPILAKYATTQVNSQAIKIDPVKPKTLEQLKVAGISVYPVAADNPFLIVNLANRKDLDKKLVNQLKKIEENILELNLMNSNFSDTIAPILSRFENLQKLQLQKTRITSETIVQLKELKYLQSLNIYKTAVSDDALENIQKIKALKYLYTWKSTISDEGILALQKAKPLLKIQHKVNEDIFGEIKLNPPVIAAEKEVFMDSVIVELKSNFRNTQIFYTTNGEDPDTLSNVYQKPLVLKETARIKTYSYKAGWEKSPIEEKLFVKVSKKVKRVALNQPPHGKYKANGALSLIDLEKGSKRFTDGNWLGYEGVHMTAILEMENREKVSRVYISALSSPGSWIHFPKGFRIWLSNDGENFRMAKRMDLPETEPKIDAELKYFDLTFAPTEAKYVKVQIISPLKNPDWHAAPGGKCWIFIDEIMLN